MQKIKDNKYWILIILSIVLLFGIREGCNKAEINNLQNQIISLDTSRFDRIRQETDLRIKKRDLENDSLIKLNNALEQKLKSNAIYYQKKINSIKSVNTYSRRQRYADSLANAMR